MQFQPEAAVRLADFYRLLREHFNYAHPWWPGTTFQIGVTALLVQQCDWSVAWSAVQRLEAEDIGSLSDLADAEPVLIQGLIRQVTFAPTKAVRLAAIAKRVLEAGFDSFDTLLSPDRDTQTVRKELLSLPGIGPETADCLLNFASEHPVFVLDAYTRRIFERLNLLPSMAPNFWQKSSYAELQQFFHVHFFTEMRLYDEFPFPTDLLREVALSRDYHGLLVELGKHHCLKKKPSCQETGKKGWQDYPHCFSHCLPDFCTACPLSRECQFTIH